MDAFTYEDDIQDVLLTENEIKVIVKRLAKEIEYVYKQTEKKLLLVGILKGSIIFMADLMREIHIPLTVDFIQISSYGDNRVSCGNITLKLDLQNKNRLSDYDILVVEDILDTGCTLMFLLNYLQNLGAHSVKLCTLLNKPDRRVQPVNVDFEGVKIPDKFVVGYGLDYQQKYRNLPFIGILKESVYHN